MSSGESEDEPQSQCENVESSELDSLPSELEDFDAPLLNKGKCPIPSFQSSPNCSNSMTKDLTLGAIIHQMFETCGKPKACPPSLQSNLPNIKIFVTSIVLYAREVPPQLWHYLVDSSASNAPNVVVDKTMFPRGYSFAGHGENGKSEVEEGQINFHRVLNLAKGMQFDSGSRRPSVEVASILNYLNGSTGKRGDFGKILCGLIVKLFDARFNRGLLPSQNLRQVHFGRESTILKGYSALKESRFSVIWKRKLCVDDEFFESFPYALCDRSTEEERQEEYETDSEVNAEQISIIPLHLNTTSTLKSLSAISMSTQEAITNAEEELRTELAKEANYTRLAAQCKERADTIRENLLNLVRRLSKEETDRSVVSVLAEKLGYDEYIKTGAEVPTVYLAVREYWKSAAQPIPWEEFWKDAKCTLDSKYKALAAASKESANQLFEVQDASRVELECIKATNSKAQSEDLDREENEQQTFTNTTGDNEHDYAKNLEPYVETVSGAGEALSVAVPIQKESQSNPAAVPSPDECDNNTQMRNSTGVREALRSAVHTRIESASSPVPMSNTDNSGIKSPMGHLTGMREALSSAAHARIGVPSTPDSAQVFENQPTNPPGKRSKMRLSKRKQDLKEVKEKICKKK